MVRVDQVVYDQFELFLSSICDNKTVRETSYNVNVSMRWPYLRRWYGNVLVGQDNGPVLVEVYLKSERLSILLLAVKNEITPLHNDLVVALADVDDRLVVGRRVEVGHERCYVVDSMNK